MKPSSSPTAPPQSSHRGFALIVTISLMVLLTLVAVGLLSLSSISLRSTGRGNAMARAQANARLAMILAIGELQKHAGPDKAITAPHGPSDTIPSARRLTGVWKSWDAITSSGPAQPEYDNMKDDLFGTWLVSDADADSVLKRDYEGPGNETIELVGAGTLGVPSPAPEDRVLAGRVPISSAGRKEGAFAWHVSDESVKARINAFRDPSLNKLPWQKSALLAGHRPLASVVKASDGTELSFLPGDDDADAFGDSEELADKLTDLKQFELLPGGESFGKFSHHLTPYSFGLLTNVREGGLKQDLTSMFEMSSSALPGPFASKDARLYQTTLGMTGPSDPYWSTLKGYYDVYKEPSMNSATPSYYKQPPESVLLSESTDVPKQFFASPVIARVEMLFSVVVRDAHGPWSPGSTKLTEHTRMVHLLYSPIITLHNPYNVSLKFDKIDIDINGIPIAFNFVVNGEAQNNRTVPYNQMYVNLADRAAKSFMISISDWQGFSSGSASPITMRPGQSLVCGPYIDGSTIFGSAGREGEKVFFDYSNNLTGNASARAKCKPGFLGKQVAFDIDWLTPDNAPYSTDGKRGVLIVKPKDRFYIEYQVKPNEYNGRFTDKMTVSAKLTYAGGKKETVTEIGGLQFDYDTGSLQKSYPTVYRYPDTQSKPNDMLVESLWESNFTPIRDHVRVKTFAMLSARARTANGGVYDSTSRDPVPNAENLLTDGRLAGIPLLHHNPARTPTVVDLKRDIPGRYSHELSLTPLKGSVDDLFDIDASNRGYLLTANKKLNGVKSGSYLELPTGPMQAIADFRRSNALTSAMLPNFLQPVANSYSSPLIATDKFIQSGVVAYPLLDHSVLANHALYDRFYFSTFAQYEPSRPPNTVFKEFMNGTRRLVAQSFEPYLPGNTTLDEASGDLFQSGLPTAEAYKRAAEYLLLRCPFNVNSVDVEAWKAVLASLGNSQIQVLWATTAEREEKPGYTSPLLPMSLVNAGEVGDFNVDRDTAKIDNELTNDFNGYNTLEPAQLDRLATEIVKQVGKRGPFLSLSEFVNRRIGSTSEETLQGALQTAINQSGINDNFLAGHVIPVRDKDVEDREIYNFPNRDASVGNPAAGAPGWLSQGDLMKVLEPGATVRGDTFVIRACGEAVDSEGKIEARAYAEAVVQRVPEYLDPVDRPSTNVWDPAANGKSAENKRFGRRFKVVSFRWLTQQEI